MGILVPEQTDDFVAIFSVTFIEFSFPFHQEALDHFLVA